MEVKEILNLSDEIINRTFTGQLVLGALTEAAGDQNAIEVFNLKETAKHVEVEIRINGVDVPLATFVRIWERNRDWLVMAGVKELVKRRMGRVYDRINTVQRALDSIIDAEFPEDR